MSHGCLRVAATALFTLALVAPAGANVYWTHSAPDHIGRTDPKPLSAGPNPNTNPLWMQTGTAVACGISVSATHVFVGDKVGTNLRRGTLASPHLGASPFGPTAGNTCGSATDGTYVYVANDPEDTTVVGAIHRFKLSDGTETAPFPVSTDAGDPCGVGVDATHIYFKYSNGPSLGRMNIDGTGFTLTWASTGAAGCGAAVDANYVYTEGLNNKIVRLTKADSPTLSDLVTTGSGDTAVSSPCGVAIDSSYVYWVNRGGNPGILRADKATGANRVRIVDIPSVGPGCGLAVDDRHPPFNPSVGTVTSSPSADRSPTVTGSGPDATAELFWDACTGPVRGTGQSAATVYSVTSGDVPEGSLTPLHVRLRTADGVSGCVSAGDYRHLATPVLNPPASPANASTVKLTGSVLNDPAVTVSVFQQHDCPGPALTSGPASAFLSGGIEVPVTAGSTTSFVVAATANGTTTDCSNAVTFTEMEPPVFTGSLPASPAADETPHLTGTATPGSTVEIFTTAGCVGAPVATGPAADFAAAGIEVPAAADAETTYYARASASSTLTPCTAQIAYVDAAAPAIGATAPASPAADVAPRVTGTATPGTTVQIHADPACTAPALGSGSAAEFASPGIQVAVAEGSLTQLFAKATANGTETTCAGPLAYQDMDAPTVTGTVPGSPADDTGPRVKGTATPGSTVELYTDPACTGLPVATGTAAAFADPGLQATVADGSTTRFYARAKANGTATPCSATSAEYAEIKPPPAPEPTPTPQKLPCLSRRVLTVHVNVGRGQRAVKAVATLDGKRIRTRRRGRRVFVTVDLRRLPKSVHVVRIRVTSSTGRVRRETRRFRTCTKREMLSAPAPSRR